ncbi:NAD(P)H-dependent oxidoreductase [Streptomyces sp. NBC_00335]|uniref:NADPH-dependent FMN reductase n=1 Tax=unclassified Streptomyces TaxID=2593676 RepID=UPI00224DC516|nr:MULTISPECIES: NADPH-dependent FMN reductase [unclassified Streptomyces]MCX5408777.1 NAD(P)H-dependent oxidoreductase [Streptomyces sp. NBC_00086]
MTALPVILLLSGSLRAGSSNETVLRTARAAAPSGVRTVFYEGLADLPHFNPDDDAEPLPGPVAGLRAAIAGAAGVLICTPEYAGTLPGSFKNLLDWTVGGTEICDKPVAWVNAAAPGRGEGAEATLRTVLGYTGADIRDAACARITVDRGTVGADGTVADEAVRAQLAGILTLLAAGAGADFRPEADS